MHYVIEPVTADQLASALGLDISNEAKGQQLNAVTGIDDVGTGCLSYLTSKKNSPSDGVIITKPDIAMSMSCQKIIFSQNPRYDFSRALTLLQFVESKQMGHIDAKARVSGYAIVDPSCIIGPNAVIEPGVILGAGVTVGAGTFVASGVRISSGSQIGKNCYIDMGAVIGAQGFGFEKNAGAWYQLRHLGSVKIADECYIGALTAIDRGFLKNTEIGMGVKIDNHCQIAHNVSIGSHTVIAGFSAIAGSVKIGADCVIAGNVAIRDHVNIADGVVVTGGSSVATDLERGIYSSGMHAIENRKWLRNHRQILQLNDTIQRLEGKLND